MKHELLRMSNVAASDHRFGNAVDISFSVYEGELTLITGLITSGLCAIPGILSGRIQNYSGRVLFDGHRISTGSFASGIAVLSAIHRYLEKVSFRTVKSQFRIPRKLHDKAIEIHPDLERSSMQLLKLMDLSEKSDKPSLQSQFLMMIFLAYQSGVRLMVLSDLTFNSSDIHSRKLVKVIEFLKNQGVAIVVLDLFSFTSPFHSLVDSFIVVRNGMTVACLGSSEFKALCFDSIRHYIEGQPFVEMEKPIMQSLPSESKRSLVLCDRKTGSKLSIPCGSCIGIYDCAMAIPRSLKDFIAFVSHSLLVYDNGSPLTIASPMDLVRSGISVINTNDQDSLLFENLSAIDNLTLFRMSRSKAFQVVRRRQLDEFVYDMVADKYASLKPITRLKNHKDCRNLSYTDVCCLMTGRWLVTNPDVIVMFSLSMNNDIMQIEWLNSLRKELIQNGKAVIIITSDLKDLERENIPSFKY